MNYYADVILPLPLEGTFTYELTKKQYDREVGRPNKSLVSFYDKMEKRFGKRGWATRQKPKNLRLASERSA